MPIELYTGQPGNGKTALMMERLVEESKRAERPIFAAGIAGLQDGLASNLEDPRQWNAIKPGAVCTCNDTTVQEECTAHAVPNGSLILSMRRGSGSAICTMQRVSRRRYTCCNLPSIGIAVSTSCGPHSSRTSCIRSFVV